VAKPCQDRHPEPAPGCRLCYLAQFDARYRKLWGITDPPRPVSAFTPRPKLRPHCLHLGRRVEYRPGCGGWKCRHVCEKGHPEAVPGGNCQTCPDYESDDPAFAPIGGVRHCLFYVLPAAGNGVWQRNVDQLKARTGLFNGRRVVAVAEGPRPSFAPLDPVSAVADRLGDGWEVVPVQHDPKLREMVAWDALWGRVRDHGPGDVCWFLHAKGVSKPVNSGVTVHKWTDAMWTTVCDYGPLVRELLQTYPIVGSFKKLGAGFGGSRSAWHYSGTFYVVRLADFWARDPMGRADRTWFGSESYPGVVYAQHEGGVLFCERTIGKMNLYLMNHWRPVEKELTQWKADHARHYVGPGNWEGPA